VICVKCYIQGALDIERKMNAETQALGRSSPKMVIVVSLLVAVFAAAVIDIVLPINLVDIAATFSVQPGTVSQLNSIIAVSGVVTALLLGVFGARFRYKSLVVAGVLSIVFCALGLFLAPSFPLAQLVVPLNGIGSVLIVVTAQAFIGNSYSLDKKAKAIGWVAAAGTLANAVGAPIVGFMTGIGGWRSVIGWFMLPTAVVSLIFVFLVFPHNLAEPQLSSKKEPFMKGFKQVLTNKSAVACLISAFLGNASVFGGMVFEVTYLRQGFSASPGFAALIGPTAGTALIAIGAVVGGHTVNRVGRKRLMIASIIPAGLLVLVSYMMQDLVVFLGMRWAASIFIGLTVAAASNLMLEQVPKFRGTAMSLSSAFSGVGTAVGITTAGAVLNLYVNPIIGFQALGLTVGALAFAGALVILFFAKDPVKAAQLSK
jgi:DHA1 family multidrug resistance protein-like MFS transporter